MTDDQVARMKELLDTEMTMAEIAAELGMSYHTFRIRVAERGIKIKRVAVEMFKADQQRETVAA